VSAKGRFGSDCPAIGDVQPEFDAEAFQKVKNARQLNEEAESPRLPGISSSADLPIVIRDARGNPTLFPASQPILSKK
jgi:hypothetical protein